MARIIDHKPHNVTLGVLDKDLKLHENLQSVTFDDVFGVRHTVHAHTDGPFSSPEDIVKAWEDGTLHAFERHQDAAEFWRAKDGGAELADRLDSLSGTPQQQRQNGGEG